MLRVCESNIIYLCVYQSVRPSSAHLSVTPSPLRSVGIIQQNCYISSPHGKSVREQQTFFSASVLLCVRRLSICPTRYFLLNHQAELNQTCYIISPHGKSVREQQTFFSASVLLCVRRLSICPTRYFLLNHQAELNQTCYITSPHGKGVREQHYFFCAFVHSCICHPSICDQQPGSPKISFTVRYFFQAKGQYIFILRFKCLDGHWTFHRSIQISNAQMGIGHSTGTFRFRMLRWAVGIPAEHTDFECSDGHLAFHRNIQI